MPLEQDVLDIGKQLEKLVSDGKPDNETASDLLTRLKELPITLDILQKTRIGMAVNVVRKATTKDDIQTLAKGLIKSWKKLLDSQDKNKTAKEKTDSNLNKSIPSSAQKSESNSTSTPSVKSSNGNGKSSSPRQYTNDPTRLKCQEMIASSLKCPQRPDFDAGDISVSIEFEIYNQFDDVGPKYKNKIKSRVMNLRDKRNVQLRLSIIDGEISPEKFAVMTTEELASDELKEERKKMTQESINDHQLAKNTGTETGQFKCGKCGGMKTSYSQLQTRSADEPMTTFVFCSTCGNRWKFC
jgi:transcription elongation factor S-II